MSAARPLVLECRNDQRDGVEHPDRLEVDDRFDGDGELEVQVAGSEHAVYLSRADVVDLIAHLADVLE